MSHAPLLLNHILLRLDLQDKQLVLIARIPHEVAAAARGLCLLLKFVLARTATQTPNGNRIRNVKPQHSMAFEGTFGKSSGPPTSPVVRRPEGVGEEVRKPYADPQGTLVAHTCAATAIIVTMVLVVFSLITALTGIIDVTVVIVACVIVVIVLAFWQHSHYCHL